MQRSNSGRRRKLSPETEVAVVVLGPKERREEFVSPTDVADCAIPHN